MQPRSTRQGLAIALTGAALSGCGASLVETASLALAPAGTAHTEATVEIYSRIARGALLCWFGPSGGMRRTHVFHADVAPESKGGAAEIVLHERDEDAASPRALRAFRVTIVRAGTGSSVQSENLRLPPETGAAMQLDVARFARGDATCRDPSPATAAPAAAAQPAGATKGADGTAARSGAAAPGAKGTDAARGGAAAR